MSHDLEVLRGHRAIAGALGMTERSLRHHAKVNGLPLFRIGGTVCARRGTLAEWLAAQERAALGG